MLRRDRLADRIIRDDREGIDRQPPILRTQIPDISIGDVGLIAVQPPKLPSPSDRFFRYPRLVTTTHEDLRKVLPRTTTDIGEVGRVDLETRGKKISMYILIGAVCVVGFLAMRRK